MSNLEYWNEEKLKLIEKLKDLHLEIYNLHKELSDVDDCIAGETEHEKYLEEVNKENNNMNGGSEGTGFMIGKRFGKLVVVSYYGRKNDIPYYICKCDCGNDFVVRSYSLTRKRKSVRACGCVRGRPFKKVQDETTEQLTNL